MTGGGAEGSRARRRAAGVAGAVPARCLRVVGRAGRSAVRLVRSAGRAGEVAVRVLRDRRRSVEGTGPAAGRTTVDPVVRLREALDIVAAVERVEPSLPRGSGDVQLWARDRVVRRPGISGGVASFVPVRQRRGWGPDRPDVQVLSAPVAADVVVLGKLDLLARPKLRAVYAEREVTLAVQPRNARSGCGLERAVRAHEVVERHAPHLIPTMLGHGRLGDDLHYLVERWVPGRPVAGASSLGPLVDEILSGLSAVHRGEGVTRVGLREHWGEGFGRRWQDTCGTGVVPQHLAAWVEDLIGRDGTLRRSFVHGDLVPSNVLRTPDGVVLVDWEHAQEGVLTNDAAKLHLFSTPPEETLETILTVLGDTSAGAGPAAAPTGAGGTPYLAVEELALCHAQLISLYPRRRARLEGHARAEVYERQVRRQVERLEQVRRRAQA